MTSSLMLHRLPLLLIISAIFILWTSLHIHTKMASSSSAIFALNQTLIASSNHPTITDFKWDPPNTLLSSLTSLLTALSLYVSLTLLLHSRPISLPSTILKLLSTLHNLILLLLSLAMSVSTALSSFNTLTSLSHVFCFPLNSTNSSSGPVFFWAYVFYLSKFYELIDTLLILLNPNKPLTFLHVYHHALVLVMCYVWLETQQSLMPIALVTNATVHVIMYSYYLSSSIGWRWSSRWKRMVTNVQILQFVVGFLFSGVFLYLHFYGGGCAGMNGWVFNAVFNASLLVLFLNFHKRAYREKRKEL